MSVWTHVFCFWKAAINYSKLFFRFINGNRKVKTMKHQKTLLNEANYSKVLKRKWNSVNDNSDAYYGVGNEIIYNTDVLKYNLRD